VEGDGGTTGATGFCTDRPWFSGTHFTPLSDCVAASAAEPNEAKHKNATTRFDMRLSPDSRPSSATPVLTYCLTQAACCLPSAELEAVTK
jgi:hypothetical protein